MKKIILFTIIAFIANIDITQANNNAATINADTLKDSNRISELNDYFTGTTDSDE